MEVRVQVGARELVVNSAVGSHVSVGKAGQSLINELYPCFNNFKLYAEDVQIADTLGFLILHLHIVQSLEGERALAPDQERR